MQIFCSTALTQKWLQLQNKLGNGVDFQTFLYCNKKGSVRFCCLFETTLFPFLCVFHMFGALSATTIVTFTTVRIIRSKPKKISRATFVCLDVFVRFFLSSHFCNCRHTTALICKISTKIFLSSRMWELSAFHARSIFNAIRLSYSTCFSLFITYLKNVCEFYFFISGECL